MNAALLRVELAAVAVAGLAAMLGWKRHRERPAVVALALTGFELAVALVGPFALGRPWDPGGDWHVARGIYIVAFGFLALVHVSWLRSAPAR